MFNLRSYSVSEHVWEVYLHEKELGSKTNMVGPCRLCLNDQSVTLVRKEKDETAPESHPLEIAVNVWQMEI